MTRAVAARLRKPPWRTIAGGAVFLAVSFLAYVLWSPGALVRDGRHDLRTNGIWVQHGWLGDDAWFVRNSRDMDAFRSAEKIHALAATLSEHNILYVYPHMAPCTPDGSLAGRDLEQTELFLDGMEGLSVMPWIGGVLGAHCFPERPQWRQGFVSSIRELFAAHPRLSGVHVNIEPMPSGNEHFILLLREIRAALPEGKTLSLAAYPPPTVWHQFANVHWDEAYFRQVASGVDQVAIMMYDTAIRRGKIYQAVMSSWAGESLSWAGEADVLFGLPAYEDAGVLYHHAGVENLENALAGIHAGLDRMGELPANYRGIAIYCEWEMEAEEWDYLSANYTRASIESLPPP